MSRKPLIYLCIFTYNFPSLVLQLTPVDFNYIHVSFDCIFFLLSRITAFWFVGFCHSLCHILSSKSHHLTSASVIIWSTEETYLSCRKIWQLFGPLLRKIIIVWCVKHIVFCKEANYALACAENRKLFMKVDMPVNNDGANIMKGLPSKCFRSSQKIVHIFFSSSLPVVYNLSNCIFIF